MYFFERNEEFKDRIICIDDDGREYTYGQIWDLGDELTQDCRGVTVLECSNDPESLARYLALLRKGCPVILIGKDLDEDAKKALKTTYEGDYPCNPELGLLLSTSGSTGDRKLVRLSYTNIQANCDSIVEYLGLTKEERPITTLPMEYTYGLSVIHSHVAVGATIILTNRTLFQKEFWEMVEKYDVTSMAGVPYTYEMFERLRLREMDLPHLKTLTQAGGHLHEELQRKFGDWAAETGRRLFVMYGQTEATARMSYVPPEKCVEKIGSIGIPIPGGSFAIAEDGELIYFGANVSMGYALKREDMTLGDVNGGCLKTGDMARMDEEGYFYITGRKKRFVKLQGKRFSLDQIQEILQEAFDCEEIICNGNDVDGIKVNTSSREVADREDEIIQLFMDKWQIRGRLVTVKYLDEIPRNASGKVLYSKL
ncbi:MAG: AMP-binding protein [Firmicutes bacterium]|nr:AMP-binding protein [Bacillota bacterium]